MDHETMKEMIFALHDGELDAAGRRLAEEHLAACAGCREMSARWKRTASALFEAPKTAPSEFFVRQVMARVREDATAPARLRWTVPALRWALVPAFGLAALVIAVMPLPAPLSMDALIGPGDSGLAAFDAAAPTSDDAVAFVLGENQ